MLKLSNMIAIYQATKQACNTSLYCNGNNEALQILHVTVLVSLLTLCHTIQSEYFVRSNDRTPCPGLPCHTFSHLLESTTKYFASNTKISFLPGVHLVEKVSVLHIVKVSNLTLAGYTIISNEHTSIGAEETYTE